MSLTRFMRRCRNFRCEERWLNLIFGNSSKTKQKNLLCSRQNIFTLSLCLMLIIVISVFYVSVLSMLPPDLPPPPPPATINTHNIVLAGAEVAPKHLRTGIRAEEEISQVVQHGMHSKIPSCFNGIDSISGDKCGRFFHTHWIGRLGNRIFQYAFACEYARTHFPTEVYTVSDWEGTIMFDQSKSCLVTMPEPLRTDLAKISGDGKTGAQDVRAKAFENHANVHPSWVPPKFWEPQQDVNPLQNGASVPDVWYASLHMMFVHGMQPHMERKHILDLLTFSPIVKKSKVYQDLYNRRGTYDVVHIRRDDIVALSRLTAPCHNCVISMESYKKLMRSMDLDPTEATWISDDPKVATPQWWHDDLSAAAKKRGAHWIRQEGSAEIPDFLFSWLPDFLLMVFARRVFRANSSFSFWGAFLNQEPNGEIYSPDMTTCVPSPQKPRGVTEYDCQFTKDNQNHWMSKNVANDPWDKVRFARKWEA